MKAFKTDLAAAVLLEALYSTDEKACAKYGITRQTLYNYRKRLAEDPELLHKFTDLKAELDKAWAGELPIAMREATQAIASIAVAIRTDPQMRANPMALEKVANALKTCADVFYTGKVIDARIGLPDKTESGL